MRKINIFLAAAAVIFGLASCSKQLEVTNPNSQTTYDFGNTESDLQEAIIACYNRIRLEGTFARVGYTMDAVRGDEVWNSSQQWYLGYDNLNIASTDEIGNQWIWRDCYHVVNRCNYVLMKVETADLSSTAYAQLKGQALFLRALAYYTLATYQQNVPLFTDYSQYSDLQTLYQTNYQDGDAGAYTQQDRVFDQIDADLVEAMDLLPSRNEGGEWAKGRATCGAAAGYYARSLMFRHKYSEALTVLKAIMAGTYGTYGLMDDYGDNFKEGDSENNKESLFEVQFLDYGMGGTDEEWTPVNISSNATQGHAVESNYASQELGSWGDLAVSPWLYNLYKAEKCTDGRLDPRLYWTAASYEAEYDTYNGVKTAAYPSGDPRCNVMYMVEVDHTPLSNTTQGGIPIAKFTNCRNNLYSTITTGLHCGINLRLMRYSDVLLRAAECVNEIDGPTSEAIGYINQVRNRVGLASLSASDFSSKDELFEWIANVERPKEFGCENGRGIDLIRWGFYYDSDRLNQLKLHGAYMRNGTASTDLLTLYTCDDSSYNYFTSGHEYFPIAQGTLDDNPNLVGNSANTSTDNGTWFKGQWTVHPVVDLDLDGYIY